MTKAFPFLATLGTLPRMLQEALALLGIEEIPGPRSTPEILAWAKDLGLNYPDDDIAWCGLFMAHICKQAGREPVKDPLWARNWSKWGAPVTDRPKLADVLVFRRAGGGGHVALYVAEDAYHYWTLGGNQGNKVSIVPIEKERLISARRPLYNNQPASVQAYTVSSTGAKTSTNEA